MDNATRRQLLEETKKAQMQGFQGSVLDVFSNPGSIQEFQQAQSAQQMPQAPPAQTPGPRPQPAVSSAPQQKRNIKMPAQPKELKSHLITTPQKAGLVSLGSGPKRGELVGGPSERKTGGYNNLPKY